MFCILFISRSSARVACRRGSVTWIQRHKNDIYVKQAVNEDMRSRSAYKLLDIQEKYKFISSCDFVVDLGAAPGGWSVALSGSSKNNRKAVVDFDLGAKLCCIDLLPMNDIPGAFIIQGDFTKRATLQKFNDFAKGRKVNVVLSDMLGNSTGDHSTDHFRSMQLCEAVLDFCKTHLQEGGSLLCKYLRGSDEKEFLQSVSLEFEDVKTVKPKASRLESSEIFLLARRKRKPH